MSNHCLEDFPEAAELARLAENAQAGRSEPFVGRGDPDTILACPHGQWRLGDVITEQPRACPELTKAGDPCKGTPGADGFCPAHKPKGDGDAGAMAAAVDADSPAEEAGDPGAEAQAGGVGAQGGQDQGGAQEAGA